MERFREPEPRRRFESLASREAVEEYLREPENRAEIIAFWEYMRFLDSLIARLPSTQRDEGRRTAHTDFTRITVIRPPQTTQPTPPTQPRPQQDARTTTADASGTVISSPTPSRVRTLHVGRHMDVTLGHTAADCWPDESQRRLVLSDGQSVTPSDHVGIIDYYRDISRLNRDGSLVEFSRALIATAEESLQQLAQGYGRMRTEADAFSGMSHLARLAHRFGFTVFDIADEGQRSRATRTSFRIASGIAENNEQWEQMRDKYKPAKIAIISGNQLVNRFG